MKLSLSKLMRSGKCLAHSLYTNLLQEQLCCTFISLFPILWFVECCLQASLNFCFCFLCSCKNKFWKMTCLNLACLASQTQPAVLVILPAVVS